MITKITHVPVFVNNLDDARKFYTEKLGFKVHTDTTMEGGFRWLTLCLAEQPDFELVLMQANTPEEQALIGKQASTTPMLCIATNDCKKTYEELKTRGIEFVSEPTQEPWGISATCKDLYGNLIYIVESTE